MFTRCPYCQQDVPNWEYQNHLGAHGPQTVPRQPPVQMMQPMAAPPMPGYAAAPSGPVRQYYHPACGGSTMMPPEALSQMAADPFAFGDKATCTCCGKQVPETEMFWADSGQSLADYRQELKNNYVYANKLNPEDFEWNSGGPVRRKSASGVGAGLVVGGIVAAGGVLVLGGVVLMFLFSGDSGSTPPAPQQVAAPAYKPPPPAPVYTPPVYASPPTYTATPPASPPVSPAPPPSYSATPPAPPPLPGMESANETLARMRRESEQRMAESRRRSEQMQRDMERRMDELRNRSRRIP